MTMKRRQLLVGATAGLFAPALMGTRSAWGSSRPIKVGLVTPQTGSLAFFGAPDSFILSQFADALAEGANGRPIEIIVKDSQSNPNRAAEVAADLILDDEVSLLLSSGGPANVLPVADQAEINGVPSLSTACPWQPFVFGRGSTPDVGFDMTYLFGFGIEDAINAYLSLWEGQDTNKKVGIVLANDPDGNAWGDERTGFPPALRAAGYDVIDPGRHQLLSDDFSAYISAFKEAECDIVMGTMIPPDFVTFWSQSRQQGFTPKIATIGKCLLMPTVPTRMGPVANGLSTELAWHPSYPYVSPATGKSCQDIANDWEATTGGPWNQTIGLKHGLIELAVDVLRRADGDFSPEAIVSSIKSTSLETAIGKAQWEGSGIANVAKSNVLGGQWHMRDDGFKLEVAANPGAPEVPVTQPLQLLG